MHFDCEHKLVSPLDRVDCECQIHICQVLKSKRLLTICDQELCGMREGQLFNRHPGAVGKLTRHSVSPWHPLENKRWNISKTMINGTAMDSNNYEREARRVRGEMHQTRR